MSELRPPVFFKEKDTMCCNEFVNSDYYEVIQPKYYVFLDPAYWRKTDVKTVNDEMAQTFKNLNEKTTWQLTIIMRIVGKDWNFFMDLPKLNKNINIVYFYNRNLTSIHLTLLHQHISFCRCLRQRTAQLFHFHRQMCCNVG